MIDENENSSIAFNSNGFLTIGVEIELQIINDETFNLEPKLEELLEKTVESKKIKKEFQLSAVEVNTDKCENINEIAKDLSSSLDLLRPMGREIGVKFATTGCHPFSRYSDCIATSSARYDQLIDRNQWLARRATIYGLHVHLGMKSGDDCIRFNNFFLNFIPHLLVLSASSPFWQGADTGLASCRPTIYESLPTAGQPYYIKNWRDFEYLCNSLKKCNSISVLNDLWWDIRPSPGFGTLEIRICDGNATLQETLAITTFIHLLAHWFEDNAAWIEQVVPPFHWLARENKWRAIRHGLDADLVTNIDGSTKPIKQDLLEWIEKISPYGEKLNCGQYLEDLKSIIKNGNSSSRQLAVYAKTGSLEEVAKFNVAEFEARKPILNYA